ncbi:MAG: chromate efflux transporter [Halothiobacillaceae bacterium]
MEIFKAFLWLGLTSFGGPIAHLGYFREEFVKRRRWLDDARYADLVALCQFLPGPASSQVGFALGLQRGGLAGGLLAWAAFTLPSAALLTAFAAGAVLISGPAGDGVIHGLKLVAVAIVAHAVVGMAGKLCPDGPRATIAVLAIALIALFGGVIGMMAAILAGGLAGALLRSDTSRSPSPEKPSSGGWQLPLLLFTALLLGLPLLASLTDLPGLALVDAFYRAGALVFGGGHVVLPLLEGSFVQTGQIEAEAFLAGYGAAQAVPGPLFTFAAYLGYLLAPAQSPMLGATLGLIAIFLPGILLLMAILPIWYRVAHRPKLRGAVAGANAAVVGVLAAVLYDPLITSSLDKPLDLALVAAGFVMLAAWKLPPWTVVITLSLSGLGMGWTGLI